jgi:Txe/YoeB family toxin of toxin-antitoxin system
MWKIIYSKKAQKDAKKVKESNLSDAVKRLLSVLKNDPFAKDSPFEKLRKDLTGAYSRRINIKHRLVYEVLKDDKIVKILSMWTHYE